MNQTGERAGKFLHLIFSDPDARKGFLSIFDQGFVSATNFFTGIIIGRSCTKEEFGLFALGFSLVLSSVGIQHSLVSLPYTIFSPRLKGRESVLFRGSTLVHQIAFSAVFTLGLAAASVFFSADPLAPVLRAVAFTGGFILLKDCIRQISYASLELGTVICFDVGAGILQIGGLLILSSLGILNSSSALWVLGVSSGLAAMAWIIFHRRTFAITFSSVGKNLLHNLSFGKWVLASGLVYSAGMEMYPWVLKFFHGTGSAGIWAACIGVASLGNPMFLGLQNYLSPRLAHAYREKNMQGMKRFVFRVSLLFAACMFAFALFLIGLGGKLLDSMYGSQYAGHGAVISLLGINFVVAALGFTSSRSLFVMNRADIDFKSNFVLLVTLVVIGIPLVKMFGLTGAAFGLICSNFISTVLKCGAFILLSRREMQEAVG